jgi:solute carrier family 35, member C2
MAFPCPLLLTSIHFGCQWIFAETLCTLYPNFFGNERIRSMSWIQYFGTALPCGLVTSGDIGLSNLSLVSISITFYTMVKASTPIFVLAWAYVFGIERITCSLLVVVMIIAMGEFLTVMGEVDFQLKGFILCLVASMMSGARWTLVQLKLQTMEPPLKTSIATMKLLAPCMFGSMLFMSMILERPWTKFESFSFLANLEVIGLGLFGAVFAICMILCEFYLIMFSSAIILMMGGVIKELITIIMGVTFFEDELNRINVAGCIIVFLGVVVYKINFHLDKKEGKPTRHYSTVGHTDSDDECYMNGLEQGPNTFDDDTSERNGVSPGKSSALDGTSGAGVGGVVELRRDLRRYGSSIGSNGEGSSLTSKLSP